MDEEYFGTRTCYQIIDSQNIPLFKFGAVHWRQNEESNRNSQIDTG